MLPIGRAQIMAYAAVHAPNWKECARQGFIIYGVFDLTSTFMYDNWTAGVAALDMLWGTALYAVVGKLLELLRGRLRPSH